jgi:acetyl-CoA carboxylase carboxyl transferase subunit beta
LKSYQKGWKKPNKTDITDSIRWLWKSKENPLVVGCMDFEFIGGSLGVMGERISRAVDYCLHYRVPLDHLQSGARRWKAHFPDAPKVSGKLSQMTDAKILISLLTDPSFGASQPLFECYDLNIAEPSALIGFADRALSAKPSRKIYPKDFTSEFR